MMARRAPTNTVAVSDQAPTETKAHDEQCADEEQQQQIAEGARGGGSGGAERMRQLAAKREARQQQQQQQSEAVRLRSLAPRRRRTINDAQSRCMAIAPGRLIRSAAPTARKAQQFCAGSSSLG